MIRILGILVIFSSLFLGGCAKMFAIGHENFKCVGDAESGKCSDVTAIYKNRQAIADGDLQNRVKKEKKDKKGKKVVIKDITPDNATVMPKIDDFDMFLTKAKPDFIPVRKNDTVRRIYIMPFIDKQGHLIDGFHIYYVDRNGEWILPDEAGVYYKKD